MNQLQQELASGAVVAGGQLSRRQYNADWLPRAPPLHTLQSHRAPITSLSLHPIHSLLATASEDTTLKIWDYETGEFERTLKGHTKSVHCVQWDPRREQGDGVGYLVSCSSDLTIKVWDPQNEYTCIKTLHGHDHAVSSICFLPGNGPVRIASASRDRTIRIWELNTGYCVRTLFGHAEWVRSVQPSQDGRFLVTGSNDQTVRVWNLDMVLQPGASGMSGGGGGDGVVELRGHDHVVECAMFIPVEFYPAIRELTGLKTGQPASILSPEPGAKPTQATSPPASNKKQPDQPGEYVLSGSRDKTLRLFHVPTNRLLHTFHGHDNWVRSIAFHTNNKYILSASDDKTVKIWDLATGRCVKTLEVHSHFCTSVAVERRHSGANASAKMPVMITGGVDHVVKIWECR